MQVPSTRVWPLDRLPRPDLVTAPFPRSVSGVGVWGAPWAAAGGAGVATRARPAVRPRRQVWIYSPSPPVPAPDPEPRSRPRGPGALSPRGLPELSSEGGELRSGPGWGARPRRAGREKRRRRELSGAPGGGRRRCRSRGRLRPQPGPRGVRGTRTRRPAAPAEHGRPSPPPRARPRPSLPAPLWGSHLPFTRGGPDFRVSGAPPWAGAPAESRRDLWEDLVVRESPREPGPVTPQWVLFALRDRARGSHRGRGLAIRKVEFAQSRLQGRPEFCYYSNPSPPKRGDPRLEG